MILSRTITSVVVVLAILAGVRFVRNEYREYENNKDQFERNEIRNEIIVNFRDQVSSCRNFYSSYYMENNPIIAFHNYCLDQTQISMGVKIDDFGGLQNVNPDSSDSMDGRARQAYVDFLEGCLVAKSEQAEFVENFQAAAELCFDEADRETGHTREQLLPA